MNIALEKLLTGAQYAQMVANADTIIHPNNVLSVRTAKRLLVKEVVAVCYSGNEGGVKS